MLSRCVWLQPCMRDEVERFLYSGDHLSLNANAPRLQLRTSPREE